MHPNDIRASFLRYFERHGHRAVPSSSLVPADDPTLLFTNAGMNQFKDVFLGREKRDYTRAATSQKCMRVSGKHNDLDNVGPSLRHHTFFEMLGNFSFGDYFKADAIPLAWTLLTDEWKLDPKRLVATVFKGEQGIPRDDEAYRIWRQFLPEEQIGELGMADNFWAMGDTGPCGRCSEIYYDRGEGVPGTGHFMTDAESGSERFVEIWNNVFMEFERKADGTLTNLPAPSIDTGMGLERISAVMKGTMSNYDTELFQPILRAIGQMAGRTHAGSMDPSDVSMRVIADHIRAMTFLIADGVVPSNEWRGYVLRKIMRRAMRHGRKLGLHEPFLFTLVDVVVQEMADAYPELRANRDSVQQVVRTEEERFGVVLTEGLPRLEEVLDQAAKSNQVVAGEQAFKLYDTYGLPRDFIEDLASAQGLQFDTAGFERAMEGQREKARAKSAFGGAGTTITWNPRPEVAKLLQTPDEFRGYEHTNVQTQIMELLKDDGAARNAVEELRAGDTGFVVLRETPFYLESGGQVSDVGRLESNDGDARVVAVSKGVGARRFHRIEVTRGSLKYRDFVTATIDESLRNATRRHHTATHLLHAALRQVLGTHVKQAGSLVAPDRLRFDFVHFSAITPEELTRIERIVNEQIVANIAVQTDIKNTQEAIATGAMALFGEKYGDRVRVVTIPGFSVELCGGTHVRATGDIGPFFITEESGVAAGVRRIEAITGLGAYTYARERLTQFDDAVRALNTKPQDLADAIEAQLASAAKLRKEVQQLKTKLALGGGAATDETRVEINGVTLVTREVTDVDKESLRSLADTLKSKMKSGIVVLAAPSAEGKVTIIATVTPDLTKRAPAGQLVKQLAPIVGGGGGGRPDFAEAGGKDPSKIREMLAESRKVVESLLAKA